MKNIFIFLFLICLISLNGCNTGNTSGGSVVVEQTIEQSQQFINETLPLKVAILSELELENIDTFEKYKKFADNTNALIRILNEQSDLFNIPLFKPTQESWNKASKTIIQYAPLINNYNEVIFSAKTFEQEQNEENLKKFYYASGKFAFETAIIVGAVFYGAAYKGVGIAYRAVGLNRLAFKCPSCVSIILSEAHWTIRTVLVEGSSQFAQKIIEYAEEANKKTDAVDKIKDTTNSIKEKIISYI